MDRLLVVSQDPSVLDSLNGLSKRFQIVRSSSGSSALDTLKSQTIASILLDLHLADIQTLILVRAIKVEFGSHIPILVLSESAQLDTALEAMRLGAYDIISKPVDSNVLQQKLEKALERQELEIGMQALQRTFAEHRDAMVIASDVMKSVNYEISRLAQLDFDLLLVGETGVGKDLIAFELHQRSARRNKPFIPISMRTLSDTLIESELFGHEKGAFSGADRTKIGKLEAANGGTVYIPEVSTLSEQVQLKLLQFMQYKTISRVGQDARKPETKLDVRVILASNDRLREQIAQGRMREDFYQRIAGVTLNIPPLRQRQDDIEPLARYFLKKITSAHVREAYNLDDSVLSGFKLYRWPGNVRELENCIKSAVAHASTTTLTLQDFPSIVQGPLLLEDLCSLCFSTKFSMMDYKAAEEQFKRAYCHEVLKRSGNNVAKAAKVTGMTPQGFRKTLHALGIKAP
jgi:DNA-binding NtrC family response regulator